MASQWMKGTIESSWRNSRLAIQLKSSAAFKRDPWPLRDYPQVATREDNRCSSLRKFQIICQHVKRNTVKRAFILSPIFSVFLSLFLYFFLLFLLSRLRLPLSWILFPFSTSRMGGWRRWGVCLFVNANLTHFRRRRRITMLFSPLVSDLLSRVVSLPLSSKLLTSL